MSKDYSERIYFQAAQGVTGWHRKLAGRWFKFTYVRPGEGWWGVSPEGMVTVRLQHDPGVGDWFAFHQIQTTV